MVCGVRVMVNGLVKGEELVKALHMMCGKFVGVEWIAIEFHKKVGEGGVV